MNTMLDLLLGGWLFGTNSGQAASGYMITVAERLHRRIIGFLVIFLVLLFICFGLNLCDYHHVNLVICMLFVAIGFIIGSCPTAATIIAGAGAVVSIRKNTALEEETRNILKNYTKMFWNIIFWGSLLIFILGRTSFRDEPWVIITLSSSVMMLGITSIALNIGVGLWKRIVFTYILISLIISATVILPRAAWIKTIGFSPKEILLPSKTETTLARLEKAEEKIAENRDVQELNKIMKKFKQGMDLTDLTIEEQVFYQAQKKKRDENILPKKISNSFKSKTSNNEYTLDNCEAVNTAAIPDKTWVKFQSENGFTIIERSGNKPDGREEYSEIFMPSGNSKRYFTWGGTIRVIGKKVGQKLKIDF